MNHRNFRLLLLLALIFPSLLFAQQQNNYAKLNQLGFYPNNQKLAITPSTSATTYNIREAETGNIVYFGELETGGFYSFSGETVKIANFTDFTRHGTFVVGIDGGGQSFPFEIGNNQFEELNKALIKALYYNRASITLEEEHAGKWFRTEGQSDNQVIIHPSAATAARPAGSSISSPGGWYDAGDFNKYIVPISSSISHLLTAYEHFESYFSTQNLTIPESANAVPDILDEARYALEWMLTMQDPNDGGVYHKLTYANFQANVMPNVPNNSRYVVQKGTAATLDFSAVMAQASRVFASFDENFSTQTLNASIAAYNWALANPNVRYNQNTMNSQYDPDISTGEYGDSNFSDELFWARSELYVTTNNDQYYPDNGWSGVGTSGWGNVQALGLFTLVHHRKELTSIGLADTSSTKNAVVNAFEWYVNDSKTAPYRSPFGLQSRQFGWGSNGGAGNLGMGILMAFQITGESKFYEGAIDVMDYLLGRNAVAYSYVTGFGDQTPLRIHHRQSEADNVAEPVPGWVAGGANPGNQNQDCGVSAYKSTLPALSYLDSYCSYSTNEITTYWNSPFVFLTAAIEVYTEDVVASNPLPIRFTAPNSKENYQVGDTLSIAWELDGVPSVNLYYKHYSNDDYTLLASNLEASTNSFEGFTIPNVPGDSLLFKLEGVADNSVIGYSGIIRIAAIREFTDFNVEVTSGNAFLPGELLTITWNANVVRNAHLFYRLSSTPDFSFLGINLPAKDGSYTLFNVPDAPGDSLIFKLVDADIDSILILSNPIEIATPVKNELDEVTPSSFLLSQNYPNPFNPSTQISFQIPSDSFVTLSVFDVTGREVARLVDRHMPMGNHQVLFDAAELSSGIYIYQLNTDAFISTKKMMLIK